MYSSIPFSFMIATCPRLEAAEESSNHYFTAFMLMNWYEVLTVEHSV